MFIECEEMFLSTKIAPLQAIHKGFILNLSGSDYFTSSIHPLYYRNENTGEKIHSCERISVGTGIDPCFRIVLFKEYQPFDEELFRRGYERIKQGIVKHIDIKSIQDELFTFASFIQNGVFVEESLKEFWLSEYSYFMGFDKLQEELFVRRTDRVLHKTVYFTLVEQNTFLGQGIAMFEEETMILDSLVINPKFRNLAYGRRLLMSMLSFGLRNGALRAIVDLDAKNVPSLKLFSEVGFEDFYPYYYRFKNRQKIK